MVGVGSVLYDGRLAPRLFPLFRLLPVADRRGEGRMPTTGMGWRWGWFLSEVEYKEGVDGMGMGGHKMTRRHAESTDEWPEPWHADPSWSEIKKEKTRTE